MDRRGAACLAGGAFAGLPLAAAQLHTAALKLQYHCSTASDFHGVRLAQATEDFMVHLLEDCNLCAIHAKRVTISALLVIYTMRVLVALSAKRSWPSMCWQSLVLVERCLTP